MNPYYVAPNGKQQGPYTLAQLQALLNADQIQTTDICWREGMPGWQTIHSTIPNLAKETPPAPPAPGGIIRLVRPTRRSLTIYNNSSHGGISRLSYIVITFFFIILAGLGYTLMKNDPGHILISKYSTHILIGFALLVFSSIFLRLQNIGINPYWSLFLFILPPVLIPMSILCAVCQEGFASEQSLDPSGKIIAFIAACVWIPLLIAAGFLVYTQLRFLR
ncbi:uncharacterized protein DUF4339 [Prosthecobacter fusiformis]|uniref:Uncharacterized protein DUF4339 n=1 Tax=Prosthecobacter fusiformis TaxID=48464 RepID=A0A4R7RMC5_9BACT|nr:DUF4339 domain-containing protein [Prosthecobacter fusiformis]TDU66531.1 uncharacterized protein DUF4339 [Prosthecobacter fusiformis]